MKIAEFFNWVEITVGREEIACYKQFLLFLQSFQKTCTVIILDLLTHVWPIVLINSVCSIE